MPSPFPGMDPYLEGNLWTSFHTQFGAEIARQLVPKLRPRYIALVEKRHVTVVSEVGERRKRRRAADVAVRRSRSKEGIEAAAMATAAPVVVTTLFSDTVPHVWVEVREAGVGKLVTAIEILSPTNKTTGRQEYLEKRDEYLHGPAHLMEIDLNRQGQRVPAREPLPTAPYYVFLSRAERRPLMEVWPIAWNQPLPKVPVPLLPGDADSLLDLQTAFAMVYDACGWDLALDYRRGPEAALPAELRGWARKMVRARERA